MMLVWLSRLCGVCGPVVFLTVLATSVKNPSVYEPYFINLLNFLPVSSSQGPLLPAKHSQSWRLGYVVGLLESDRLTNETAIAMAAKYLGVDPESLNVPDLLNMGTFLSQHEQHKTGWSKVLGLWSFVNIMWVFSILGIAATIGPVLYLVLGSFILTLVGILRTCVVYVHRHVRPLYNLAALYIVLCILLSSQRYPPSISTYVSLTACALSIPAFYLSIHQCHFLRPTSDLSGHYADGHYTHRSAHHAQLTSLALNTLACLTFFTAAIDVSSSLIAFLAVTALFGALGFQVIPLGCGWLVGYGDRHSTYSGMTASSILIMLMLLGKHAGIQASTLDLFAPGVSIMGGTALGVGGLILTSCLWRNSSYALANALYAAVCCALALLGAVLHVTPLRCTSTVFLALWLSLKVAELLTARYAMVTIFLGSLLTWQLSFFVKAHPEYIVSLFDMFSNTQ
jgi:hypothetical protein